MTDIKVRTNKKDIWRIKMCNHDDNKMSEYLEVFDFPGYEIYICECGVLINISDIKNYDNPAHPMNKQDIDRMMAEIIKPTMKAIDFSLTELKLTYEHLKMLYGE